DIEGFNLGKLISRQVRFEDSRNDILVQAVDVLTSFSRRFFLNTIDRSSVGPILGRLQICQKREKRWQSVELISLSGEQRRAWGDSSLARQVEIMTKSGRSMFKPERRAEH